MATRIQLRRDTAANWTSVDPVLAAGEPGFEEDTGKHKIGDGSTAWTGLPYFLNEPALSATFAGKGPATDLVLYVSPTGSDGNDGLSEGSAYATLAQAFATATSAGGAHIKMSGGTHPTPWQGMPSNVHIEGAGMGVTILRLPDAVNRSVLINADRTNGNHHISLSNLTIDGNRANQSGQAAAHVNDEQDGTVFGIEFHKVRDWALTNVELQNVDGKGAYLIGDATVSPASYDYSLVNVYAHDNALDGIHVGGAMREGQYANVRCFNNGRDGIWLDVSEAHTLGVYCHGNTRDGIWIRNTFASSYWNLKANKNGRHGIRALGLVNCDGGGWSAYSNGQRTAGSSDVWFDGNATYSYGATDRTTIVGIACGAVNPAMPWIDGNQAGPTEAWALTVDAAITGDLKVLNVSAFAAGTSGLYNIPAYGAGNFVMTDFPGSTPNVRTMRGGYKTYGAYYPGNTVSPGGGIWSGSGVPSASLGGNGDYYFRNDTPATANQRLYVKSAGAWVGVL